MTIQPEQHASKNYRTFRKMWEEGPAEGSKGSKSQRGRRVEFELPSFHHPQFKFGPFDLFDVLTISTLRGETGHRRRWPVRLHASIKTALAGALSGYSLRPWACRPRRSRRCA